MNRDKILIAHPDEKTRRMIKSFLEQSFSLIVTDSLEQALFCLSHDSSVKLFFADFLWLDQNPQSVSQAKSHLSSLYIIGLLNKASPLNAPETQTPGLTAVIQRPFTVEALTGIVQKYLK